MIKIEKTLLFIIVLVLLVGAVSATETLREDQASTIDETVASDISIVSQDNKIINNEENKIPDENKIQNIKHKRKDTNLKQDGIIEVHNYTELQNAVNNASSAGADTTIRLLEGSYNNTGTITWAHGGMVLTIDGNGQTINGHQQQVFSISNGASMILKNIIITNYNGNEGGIIYNDGTLTLVNSTLENNQVIAEIGQTSVGIIYNNGTLIINDTSLNNNRASHAGAIENIGTLIINNSTLNNNTAFEGGSIHNGGTLTINNSTLNNNTAHQEGGAIYNTYPGIITITDSILNYNTAINGGVIRNIGTLTISNSTLNHNTAKDEWFTSGLGGAIYNMRTLTLTNSTLNNNTAKRGGAIFDTSSLNIKTSTFEENKATSGGAIFGNANPGLSCNITQNIFKKNTADDKETLVFNSTYNEKLIKNNTYESTDIKLKTINITLQEEKTYLAGEDVKLNITLTLEQPENYDEDIQEKISKTIYLNNEQIGTTIQTNYTITNIHIGENKVYVTCYNQQSNNLSFTVNGNYETNVSNYTELVQAVKTATTERYVSYKINLLPGDYNATKDILWHNTTTKNIIINGNNNTIDMKKHWLLFYIPEEQEITLENIIITNGSNLEVIDNYGTLTINNSTLENFNSTSPISSSINNFGILTINNSTIKNNYAIFGGAIYNFNNGILTINNSTLENNNAERGGAIYNDGILTIMDSTLKDNIANETESIIFNNGTINKIENTKFDCNYPANFIIENDVITLKSDDDFITVGNFTIIMDDEELQGSENFENYPVLPNSKNVKLILNGTDIKTANNQFILRKPKETNITCYTELVNAIEEAKIMDYSIYKINLLPGDYNATTSINWENSATKKIIINGNNNTLNGQNTHQFIKINSGHNLTLENITITNATSSNGGAILNYYGTLTVSNSTFNNNQATMDGGAIRNYMGTLTVSNSTFNNNQADNGGGAIDNYMGTLTVSNSTFNNNTAEKSGGAIYDRSHDILTNITSCNFINNTAPRGAAIHATGWINLTNNTFKENTATSNQETIDLNGYWNGILEGNVYESTDIALDEIILSVNNNHRTPEGVELNYTIQPVNPMYYWDFEDGINDITLYINGQKNITTKYENYTLSGLELGEYEVYYTTCNQQSNTITFKVICDAEVNITNYTQLVQAIENATREEYNSYKINLQPGDYNATTSINWENSATRKIVINGNGNTLDGQNTYQFINIAEGQELILDNITIRNYTSENSGAIYNNGTLTINNSTLEYNNITRGVIWNYGTLTINNSTLENNIGFTGGAIDNTYGTVIIINSTLEKNHAYRGGAIFNDGMLTIKDSTIENNTAVWEGGAIFSNDVRYSYVTLTNSNFTYNTAENGAVIYQYSNSNVHFNMTNNLFKNNTARDKETLNFGTVDNERIMEENRYENTDILLNEIKLSIVDNQNYVILNYTIKPANPDYYLDFEDGLNDITIYINGEKNITTKYENTTLTDLKPGEYTAYFTSCNQQSNTITFIIKADSQIKTPETVYEYYSEVNNKIPLIITDISGQKGTITVTVKDQDEYKKLFIGFNVENGYNLSSQRLVEELENLYKNLDSSYVINVTYSSDFTLPSSTEFTLNINKQRNTTIVYDILNNTEGNVQINITVQDAIYKTPITDANIQITGTITQNTTSGIITDNTLTPGDYTINIKYQETDEYKESTATINFTVEIDKDKKIAELQEQVENLTKKLEEAQETIENLNNNITNLTQEIKQKDEQVEKLIEQINNLTTQLDEANDKINNLTKQLEEANEEIQTLNNIIKELTKPRLNTTITINPIKSSIGNMTKITANIIDENGEKVTGGKIIFKINGITLKDNAGNTLYADVKDGIASLNYKVQNGWIKNTTYIEAVYSGNHKYSEARTKATDILDISPGKTTITLDKTSISAKAGQTITLRAKVLDANGDRVNSDRVVFKLNGKTLKDEKGNTLYAQVIDGEAVLDYTIPATFTARTYTITAVFGGSYYQRSETRGTIILEKKGVTINSDKITTTDAKTTIKATITDETGELLVRSTKIAIKVNGITILNNATSNNGKIDVTFNTTFKPGMYELLIISAENGIYKSSKMTTVLKI